MISAILSGNMEIIKYVESLGLSFFAVDKNKVTALHAACRLKKNSKETL